VVSAHAVEPAIEPRPRSGSLLRSYSAALPSGALVLWAPLAQRHAADGGTDGTDRRGGHSRQLQPERSAAPKRPARRAPTLLHPRAGDGRSEGARERQRENHIISKRSLAQPPHPHHPQSQHPRALHPTRPPPLPFIHTSDHGRTLISEVDAPHLKNTALFS